MNQNRTTFLSAILILASICITKKSTAQEVSKAIVVEHFTNSVCGICASRNPGLFANIASQQNVIQISFHPSSPYSSCILNKYNKAGNDRRTNFYGIYGSTPKITINGTLVSGSFNSSSIFDSYKNLTSAFEMRSTLIKVSDSFVTEITVKKVANSPLIKANLYAFAAEDSLNYSAPNGEKLHHNVYRTSFFEGEINLPSGIGDSIIFAYKVVVDVALKENQMHSIALLQDGKSLIQASRSGEDKKMDQTNSQRNIVKTTSLLLFPNPSNGVVNIDSKFIGESISIFNAQGQLVEAIQIQSSKIYLQSLASGIYSFEINRDTEVLHGRVLISN